MLQRALAAKGIAATRYAVVPAHESPETVPEGVPMVWRRENGQWVVRLSAEEAWHDFVTEAEACEFLYRHLTDEAQPSVGELDLEEAVRRARVYLDISHLPTGERSVDLQDMIMERHWCFVFFWNSVEYIETGDVMKSLVGNGPVVVPKDGSEVFGLGTYRSASDLLDEYEQKHRIKSGGEWRLG